MPVLRFDDPCATARHEAAPRLARGLELRSTLFGFEGDEPTLYVRSAPPWVGTARDSIATSLVVLPRMLGIDRPVDPRGVRREDRRRAQAYRSAFRPTTVEAAS